jgi:hypothetical protein
MVLLVKIGFEFSGKGEKAPATSEMEKPFMTPAPSCQGSVTLHPFRALGATCQSGSDRKT